MLKQILFLSMEIFFLTNCQSPYRVSYLYQQRVFISSNGVNKIDWSRDQNVLVLTSQSNADIHVYKKESLANVYLIQQTISAAIANPQALAVNYDGTQIIIGNQNGTVQCFKTLTPGGFYNQDYNFDLSDNVRGVQISEDGLTLVVLLENGDIKIYQRANISIKFNVITPISLSTAETSNCLSANKDITIFAVGVNNAAKIFRKISGSWGAGARQVISTTDFVCDLSLDDSGLILALPIRNNGFQTKIMRDPFDTGMFGIAAQQFSQLNPYGAYLKKDGSKLVISSLTQTRIYSSQLGTLFDALSYETIAQFQATDIVVSPNFVRSLLSFDDNILIIGFHTGGVYFFKRCEAVFSNCVQCYYRPLAADYQCWVCRIGYIPAADKLSCMRQCSISHCNTCEQPNGYQICASCKTGYKIKGGFCFQEITIIPSTNNATNNTTTNSTTSNNNQQIVRQQQQPTLIIQIIMVLGITLACALLFLAVFIGILVLIRWKITSNQSEKIHSQENIKTQETFNYLNSNKFNQNSDAN